MFELEKAKNRSFALDLVRVTAAFSVISVHFFMNARFYDQPMLGKKMFVLCAMRTFFSCCVPLFLVLTGYLLCQKKLERRFYYGLGGTLTAYVLAGSACVFYKAVFLHVDYTASHLLRTFLEFSASDYGWYVEMYIGLFLLVPFLNLIYNGLDSKKKKDALMLTLFFLTVLPTLTNNFNLADPAWWNAPALGTAHRVLPRRWLTFYPVTYYFVGCYLREFGLKFKTRAIVLLLALATLGFGAFNYWQSYGVGFVTGNYVDWGGFEPCVITVLLFSLLSRVKGDRLPLALRYGLWKVSDLCLSIYLVSYMFDTAFYPWLNEAVPAIPDRLFWFPVMTVCVFVCSMLLSLVLHWVQELLGRLFVRLARAAHTAARKDPAQIRQDKARMSLACFALCFGAVFVLALWKCPFGFGSTDDAFYLTIPHRLSLGDALFADEWHVSQMSGLLTLPFVWVYRALTGSMDGVLLASRYGYVVFHALVTLLFYSRVRGRGPAAMAAALSWFLFTPFDIMALSYNTMALDFILLSGVLLATAGKRLHSVASGICLAAGVLCCPYFAAAYFLYVAAVGVRALLRRKGSDRRDSGFFSPARLLWLTVGVGLASVLFLIYVLATCGIGGLLSNLPYIFSDPEHPAMDPIFKLQKAWRGLVDCHPKFPIVLSCFGVLLLALLADRNRQNHRAFYLILSSLLTLAALAMFYPLAADKYYHTIMFPLIFVGAASFLLCQSKPWELFAGIFVPGLIYTAAVIVGSNQYVYALTMASALTNIASFLFLGQLLREMRERPDDTAYALQLRRGAAALAVVTVLFLLFVQVYVKRNHCFVDDPPYAQDYQLQEGPGRGIHTAEYKGTIYEDLNRELQYYKTVPQGKILILNERTWCYLSVDPLEYATFSAWISGENQAALDRLELYYQSNPDKVPDYIYLSKTNKFDDPEAILTAALARGYALTESERSWYLERA